MAQQQGSSSAGGKLRIALAYPGPQPATFIQAHIDRLQEVVLVLNDGMTPLRASDGTVFMRTTARGRGLDMVQAAVRGRSPQQEHYHRIAHSLKKHRVEVVLAEFGYMAMEMLEPCRLAGIPMVAHFFGIDAHATKYLERFGNYARVFSTAKASVVVSREMERQLITIGAPADKVHYICCGVDVGTFTAADPSLAPPHFVAVGRFVEKKAPQLTLLAFANMLALVPEAQLTMVGDGRGWELCHQMVSAMGLQDKVDLCGPREPAEVLALMRRSRAFVQHSVNALNGDSEGTPVAIQEAMASGLPVISTRHAGILDIMDHEVHGLLCDPLDIHTMTAHMVRLANDPQLARDLGQRAMHHAQQTFPLRTQIARLQEVLRNAVREERVRD